MKTPRELILEKYRPVRPKLERIRPEDLAAYTQASLASPDRPRPSAISHSCLARKFWAESLWPWRRIWLGMSALWLIIMAVNLAFPNAPAVSGTSMPRPNPEVLAVLREQQQLLTQLLESAALSPTARHRPAGPRSEQRLTTVVA